MASSCPVLKASKYAWARRPDSVSSRIEPAAPSSASARAGRSQRANGDALMAIPRGSWIVGPGDSPGRLARGDEDSMKTDEDMGARAQLVRGRRGPARRAGSESNGSVESRDTSPSPQTTELDRYAGT